MYVVMQGDRIVSYDYHRDRYNLYYDAGDIFRVQVDAEVRADWFINSKEYKPKNGNVRVVKLVAQEYIDSLSDM